MLRSDMEPRRKICGRGKKKPDPLEDLSSKHGYIRKKEKKAAAASVLWDLLFTADCL